MERARAERRHHQRRVKRMWRRRVRLWRLRSPEDEERLAVRRAVHGTCPCWLCSNKFLRRPDHLWRPDNALDEDA
jgi:hypothetical protein